MKGLSTDLGKLKRLLQAESLYPKAIAPLVLKIAGQTARIGSRAEGKRAEPVKQLAAELEKAANDA